MQQNENACPKEMDGAKKVNGLAYDVIYYHYGNPTPREVELIFQMPYPCWLKLEDSQLLQTFLEGLEALQKEGSL